MSVPTSVSDAAKEAVKVAAFVGPVLATLAAVLPDLHVPASDTAIVTSAVAALAAFVSWAKSHKLVSAAVRLFRA